MGWEIDWESLGLGRLADNPLVVQAVGLAAVALAAWLSLLIIRKILVAGIRRFVAASDTKWDDRLVDARFFIRVGLMVPALVARSGIQLVPGLDERIVALVTRLTSAALVLLFALSINAALNATNEIYSRFEKYRSRPIKSYVQLLNMIVGGIAAVVIVATLFDKSPLIFLSGIGAMTAVLLLVFKDTILSLVASVQLTAQDMVRVGDWIEMPQCGADGDVVDAQLHTVTVQNWDKTITTIPTHRLITDSFKNWRGMSQAGARRIKRAIYIDVSTIRMQTDDEVDHFTRFALLKDYVKNKEQELTDYNAGLATEVDADVNRRRLTNIGTFRAYTYNYLKNHPKIHEGMTLMVRQLGPGPEGLPLEIYCFTNTTEWAVYEDIQSDIFDHLLAIVPEFGLRLYQKPAGSDFANLR